MKLYKYRIQTNASMDIVNIDNFLYRALEDSGVQNGIMLVYCPHTTAGITVNENGDPDVQIDLKYAFNLLSPKRKEYHHFEGNSHAHLLSSLVGVSENFIIEDFKILLGTWQSVYFCDFDGPRNRELVIKIIEG